jgi:hypothetical protein
MQFSGYRYTPYLNNLNYLSPDFSGRRKGWGADLKILKVLFTNPNANYLSNEDISSLPNIQRDPSRVSQVYTEFECWEGPKHAARKVWGKYENQLREDGTIMRQRELGEVFGKSQSWVSQTLAGK